MAITLTAAVAEATMTAELATATATRLNTGTSGHIEIRSSGGTILLVDLLFDQSDPEWTASGAVVTLDVSPAISATAVGGTATAPAVWRLFDGAGVLVYTGTASGDTITSGDVININSLAFTIQAS